MMRIRKQFVGEVAERRTAAADGVGLPLRHGLNLLSMPEGLTGGIW